MDHACTPQFFFSSLFSPLFCDKILTISWKDSTLLSLPRHEETKTLGLGGLGDEAHLAECLPIVLKLWSGPQC